MTAEDKDKDLYINYNIKWQQAYLNWGEFVEAMDACMLQNSQLKEAKEVINKVKTAGTKNDDME